MRERIRAAWQAPAAPGARAPRMRDVWVVGIVCLIAGVEAFWRPDLTSPWIPLIVTLVVAALVPWRRTHPLAVITVAGALAVLTEVAQLATGASEDVLGAIAIAIVYPYALFRWGTGRARVVGSAILFAGTALSVVTGDEGVAGATAGLAVVGGTCLAGALRRERVLSRARERDRIRAREREALARDLHDTVAHHVSAVVLHAQGAGALLRADPERAGDSLAQIEAEAKDALSDMRSLVRVLREEPPQPAAVPPAEDAPAVDPPFAPTPGLDEVRALTETGPPAVRVRVDVDDLPDVLAQTVFRIAQESVTNARRHARRATAIDVLVCAEHEGLIVEVTDDGSGSSRVRPGFGILGMTERATLFGGTLEAGPDPRGGWRVRAVLPREDDR
ncbi:sensor histidine kinase [Microbacterium sp. G2-8]|uniref:sensor histidine kinase n=1 Tax=Microbacterium sp. G2-8 TaxID=2842454 RepID=UPI001C8ACC2C|nr:histidine kinase [Microbacterium sp. G2-8]